MSDPAIVVEDVRGVPMRVFAQRPRSLAQVPALVRARGAAEYLVCGDRRVTDHALLDDAALIAAQLRARGLVPGDRVAILAANSIEWIAAFWGTVLAGGIVAALNGWWKADEVRYALGHSAPRFLVVDGPRLDRIADEAADCLKQLDGVFTIGAADSEVGSAFDVLLAPTPIAEPHIGHEDDPVAIFYTSGTTGRPKGAIATHRSWIAAAQCLRYLAAAPASTQPASESTQERLAEVGLATLPLFHVSGCQATAVTALFGGSKTVMLTGKFDAGEVLRLIEAERITRWSAVPTMVSRVCRHRERDTFDRSSLRSISYGGSPEPPELPGLVRDTFPNVASIANAYGLTESGTVISVNAGADRDKRPDSVGRPFPVIEVQIGEGNPPLVMGEVRLRGPMIMPGYWNDPAATAEIITADGWLCTGDLGHLDEDGYLYITDRAKDMIIRGGENVYPAEIEQRLGEHPDVIEAAVIGEPDIDLGERVKAIVRLADGARATDDELAAFVGTTLAAFKVPVVWQRTEAPLPRNATGKILKTELRGQRSHLEELL